MGFVTPELVTDGLGVKKGTKVCPGCFLLFCTRVYLIYSTGQDNRRGS